MPRQLKQGDVIKGYTITAHLNTGAMANAFAANAPTGTKVFLKSYKSPTCAVPWYSAYMEYQRELKKRLENHLVGKFCVRLIDQFEFKFGIPTFFQVFEFVHAGEDLGQILEKLRRSPKALDWHQRHILAKVMMAAIHQLHDAKIVHGDLKPPNLQLFKDPTIKAGYQLKLIDMDFSILPDKRAPWHGSAAYVGTPGYFSPEHLAGGNSVPEPASDVFTCGLILNELLAQGHPYHYDNDADYLRATKAHSAKKPMLLGKIEGDPTFTEHFAGILHRCLSPSISDRPSAKEVHLALNGRPPTVEIPKLPPPPESKPTPGRTPPPLPPAPIKHTLRIENATGKTLELGVTTHFGKHLLRTFGDEAKFADDLQFIVERRDGQWWIVPPPNPTSNFTMLNGVALDGPKQLKSGDQVALGSRTTKGRTILPLTLKFA